MRIPTTPHLHIIPACRWQGVATPPRTLLPHPHHCAGRCTRPTWSTCKTAAPVSRYRGARPRTRTQTHPGENLSSLGLHVNGLCMDLRRPRLHLGRLHQHIFRLRFRCCSRLQLCCCPYCCNTLWCVCVCACVCVCVCVCTCEWERASSVEPWKMLGESRREASEKVADDQGGRQAKR
jgi:hypothetical protein